MRAMLAASSVLVLCSCGVFESDAGRGYSFGKSFGASTAFTTADVRLITERMHPLLKNPVLCVEPAPDVTKAIATQLNLTASGGNGAATGSLGASGASAEAAAELAGRSTALLGLRDGLYRACEAYANGIIGQDAYGLVLARYSQLMTTLFLGQDIVGATGEEAKTSISASIAAAAAASNAPAAPKGGVTSSTDSTTKTTSSSVTKGRFLPDGAAETSPRIILAGFSPAADAAGAAPAPAPVKQGTGDKPPTDTTSGGAPVPGSLSNTAALSLTRMNEDYLHNGPFGVLLVACINDGDLTRYRGDVMIDDYVSKYVGAPGIILPEKTSNLWLHEFCASLKSVDSLMALSRLAAATELVDPTVASIGVKRTIQTQKNSGDPTIRAVQQALAKQKCPGCDPGSIDGIAGKQTRAAISAYEHATGLLENGDPFDPQVLGHLKIRAASLLPADQAKPRPI